MKDLEESAKGNFEDIQFYSAVPIKVEVIIREVTAE